VPDPVNGFVSSTDPADNDILVSMATDTIVVYFNQPMMLGGVGSAIDSKNYKNNLVNLDGIGSDDVPFTEISYSPANYAVTITIDTTDPGWTPGTNYSLTIEQNIENACGVKQGVNVEIQFQTVSAISGQVLADTDTSGDFSAGDAGIAGVTLELDDSVCTPGVDCETAITNAGGDYIFPTVAPGDYTIIETDPASYSSVADTGGANDNLIPVSLPPGEVSSGNNFLDAP
jgi:hypothetical protein